MRTWLLAALLATGAVQAGESPAGDFNAATNAAVFPCELRSSEVARSADTWGMASPETSAALSTCVAEARDKLKAGYTAYVATKPPKDADASAKALYAASLTYLGVVSRGEPMRRLQASREFTEMEQARSMFRVDAGL